jgi:predicted permease
MLFRSIAQTELPDSMPWGYLISYFGGAFLAFGGAMLVGWHFFARRLDEQGVLGLGASFSNTAMLGIPLVITAYGPDAALPLFALIACHSLVLLPPTTMLIEAARGEGQSIGTLLWTLFKGVAATPIIWGLSAGLAFAMAGFPLPGPVDSIAGGIGAAAAPCALFALGASLTRYRLSGNLREDAGAPAAGVVARHAGLRRPGAVGRRRRHAGRVAGRRDALPLRPALPGVPVECRLDGIPVDVVFGGDPVGAVVRRARVSQGAAGA